MVSRAPTLGRTRLIPLTFHKGLNEAHAPSVIPPGFSSRLQNWEPEPAGGLRARRAWSKGSTTGGLPGTRACVGAGYFARLITPGVLQATVPVYTDGASGTSPAQAVAWPARSSRGSLWIAVVALSPSAGSATATANGWTQAVTNNLATTGFEKVAIFYKTNQAPAANAADAAGNCPTLTAGGGGSGFLQFIEVAGIALTSPLDQTANDGSSDTTDDTISSGTTGATTQAVEFVIALLAAEDDGAQGDPTNSFLTLTDVTHVGASGSGQFGVYYKSIRTTGAQSTVVAVTDTRNGGAIATFKGWFTGTPAAGQTSVTEFIAAHNDATEYDIWAADRETLDIDTWANPGSIATADPSQLVAMAPGLGRTWLTNPQLGSAYVYDGITVTAITGAPAGRCLAVHKNRVWIGGTDADPGRLWYSEINDGQDWPVANYIDFDRSSGEPIEDITPFEDGLLIAQRTAVYFLTGSGLNTFDSQRLTGGGAAPGRVITPTPYGAVIAGRKQVYLWTGEGVVTISHALEASYGMTGSWMSCSFWNDHVYILDQGSGTVFVLDVAQGTWRTEKVGSSNDQPAILYNHDFTQVFGPKSSSVGSLLNFRHYPAATRGVDFSTLSTVFAASTDELWEAGPETAFTPMHLHLKLRQRGGDASDAALQVTPVYDGVAQTAQSVSPGTADRTFRARLDVAARQGIFSALYQFDQTVPDADAAVFDIEEVVLEVLEEARR